MAYVKLSQGMRTNPENVWFFRPGTHEERVAARNAKRALSEVGGVLSVSEACSDALRDIPVICAPFEAPVTIVQAEPDPWDLSPIQKGMLAELARRGRLELVYKAKLTGKSLVRNGFAEYVPCETKCAQAIKITDKGRVMAARCDAPEGKAA